MSLVEIQQVPALRVAGVVHAGPFHLIGKAFDRLHQCLAPDGQGEGLIGVYCARDQWALAGVVLPPDAPLPDGLTELTIPAGRAGVMTVRGPYEQLEGAWQQLAGVWPRAAKMRPRGVISYERYQNTPDHSRPENLVTRLYLPVE